MPSSQEYGPEPTREEIDRMEGPVILDFGTNWCPHCQALAPQLDRLLESHPEIRHIKVEDGKGRPLGRSFRVKLWPTLVFLRDGQVVKQVSRPDPAEVEGRAGGDRRGVTGRIRRSREADEPTRGRLAAISRSRRRALPRPQGPRACGGASVRRSPAAPRLHFLGSGFFASIKAAPDPPDP